MQKQAQNPGFPKKTSVVPYTDHSGNVKTVDARTLTNWRKHHGTASCGTKVHSLQSALIGRSTIVKDAEENYSSFLSVELEVMSMQLFGSKTKKS